MAYIKNIFDKNFLEYASYVIKDRAIPDLEDGLKPVQRRIMHSLFEMDDGKFHKVANVVGHCMQYHPHGDASIGDALVVLACKDFFIEKQGNFGNIFTGDRASAARYIECRATGFSRDIFYNPKITKFADSYDGRKKEPLLFPAKIPVALIIGAEGIAVGMSTKILPHNILEVLEAEKACLSGKDFTLYPDFPSGAFVDVSEYREGNGKVLVRAKLDTSDPKKIVIRELPFGSTTESLIASVENAAKAGRLKIQSIDDYTTENVEIEIKLARGVYSEETVDALYAWTECEQMISVQFLLIKENFPCVMTVSEVLKYHAKQLVRILIKELELEKKELTDKLHLRNLERIFIEERIYKAIENQKTAESVAKAVIKGFLPFMKEVGSRQISDEDIEHLLKIPIRRISLYDINKARNEMDEIKARIKEINAHLKNITAYALSFLDALIAKIKANEDLGHGARRTVVSKFEKTSVKEVVKKDLALKYDKSSGYVGTTVGGDLVAEVSPFDRILIIKRGGIWTVQDIQDKVFIGENAWWIGLADKDVLAKTVFTVIYKDKKSGLAYIKRCVIEGWIMNKEYSLLTGAAAESDEQEKTEILLVSAQQKFSFTLRYVPKPRLKVLEEEFKAHKFIVKGIKAGGVRLSAKEVKRVDFKKEK
ncbi:MAG: DNA topoisomerase IV subunit A [Spirochaetaceae bacterium]|jgi:topoisomerase-4 subunit A|nr:DNA topoisomerase IV subunit A [Spirochaetaceae bacterium]